MNGALTTSSPNPTLGGPRLNPLPSLNQHLLGERQFCSFTLGGKYYCSLEYRNRQGRASPSLVTGAEPGLANT